MQLNRIGRILDVRRVASSRRTVTAVWRSYAALHEHFAGKSVDHSLDSRERTKFAGLEMKLGAQFFYYFNLGLMLHVLDELSNLSLPLRRSNITLQAAKNLVSKQVEIFSAKRDTDSFCYSEACQAVARGNFKGVALAAGNGKQFEIPKGQFCQALVDSITTRLLPEGGRNLSRAVEAPNIVSSQLNKWPDYSCFFFTHVCGWKW